MQSRYGTRLTSKKVWVTANPVFVTKVNKTAYFEANLGEQAVYIFCGTSYHATFRIEAITSGSISALFINKPVNIAF